MAKQTAAARDQARQARERRRETLRRVHDLAMEHRAPWVVAVHRAMDTEAVTHLSTKRLTALLRILDMERASARAEMAAERISA